LIDDFSQADKPPHIAVSVDMLDTGIDVPEIVNLVFFKIVRSKTKFWQMLGRGTRLCPDLFGPGKHKDHFLVFDFCQNFEFFNQNPKLAQGRPAESLAKLLFVSRVHLVSKLDEVVSEYERGEQTAGIAKDRSFDGPVVPLNAKLKTQLCELRVEVAARLMQEVAAMSPDNFIVRPQRQFVEKYVKPEAWTKLGLDEQTELIEHVAGVPSALVDDDMAAKQFDLLIFRTQLSILRRETSFAGLQQKVVHIGALLEELSNVPMVAEELPLILEVQTEEYWLHATVPMLETVRRRLRDLVKLIELRKRPIVYTDFEDEISEGAAVAIQGVSVGTDMDRFRLKARHFLKGNENHISVLKLKRNEPLNSTRPRRTREVLPLCRRAT